MKTGLLIASIAVCALLAAAKVWGLLFVEFSAKQLVYAAALAGAAVGMFLQLRAGRADAADE